MADLPVSVRRDLLVDVDPQSAARAAAKLGWARASDDWRAAIEDPSIAIIDIVTPPALHEEIALRAIANGKHVFCEKPITNDSEAGWRMHQAAREAGVVAQVGFNYRHISAVSAIKAIIDSGRLGAILQFRGSYHQDPLFTITDFGWRGTRRSGGSGATGDIGSHILDIAQHLCGPLARVLGQQRMKDRSSKDAGWLATPDAERLDDAAAWLGEFADGALGIFSAGFYSYAHKNHLTFSIDGTRGSVQFDWNRPGEFQVAFADEPEAESGFRTVLVSDQHPDVWYPVAGLGQGYIDGTAIQIRHFLRAIAEGTPAHPDFGEAAQVQAIVEAIEQSSASRSWVEVAPPAGAES
jgi:predicted dehydrogenase